MTQSESEDWVVFISHSSTDAWVSRQIARHVEESGATAFLDEAGIDVGEDFEERILGALANAKELLVLLTPWSLSRSYVWAEIGAAWGRRIPIIGVLHGITASELQSNPGVPVLLKRRDFVDINEIDTYFQQLRRRASS